MGMKDVRNERRRKLPLDKGAREQLQGRLPGFGRGGA